MGGSAAVASNPSMQSLSEAVLRFMLPKHTLSMLLLLILGLSCGDSIAAGKLDDFVAGYLSGESMTGGDAGLVVPFGTTSLQSSSQMRPSCRNVEVAAEVRMGESAVVASNPSMPVLLEAVPGFESLKHTLLLLLLLALGLPCCSSVDAGKQDEFFADSSSVCSAASIGLAGLHIFGEAGIN